VYGPAWSVDVVAAILLGTVLYCAGRLTFLVVARRQDRRDIHAVHIVMGSLMAAMLLNVAHFGSDGAWEVVFLSIAGWFVWRAAHVMRTGSSRWLAVHESNHIVASVAMVAMFAGGMEMSGGSMTAMSATMGSPRWLLPAALILGAALAAYGTWNAVLVVTMSAPALAAHQGCVGSGSAKATGTNSQRPVTGTAPRLALCCDVVMAVSMVYMFAWFH
jgi:hypothetical protein